MEILVLTRSDSFKRHLQNVIGESHRLRFVSSARNITSLSSKTSPVFLVHSSSFRDKSVELIKQVRANGDFIIAVAADNPELKEMLDFTPYRISAYFNSYMADVHYRHMLRLLESGQSWFIPDLLARALEIASQYNTRESRDSILEQLTPRETDVANAVAQGLTNKNISRLLKIKERTVKTHLTHIFEKLNIKDRTVLAIRMNEGPGQQAGDNH